MPETVKARYNTKALLLRHIGALAAVSMWGLSFVATKVLLEGGMSPTEMYIYRFALTYLVILLISHQKILANNWRDELAFALCGLTAGSIYFLAENYALQYTLVSNVSLLTSTSPLITMFLVACLYRSERPTMGAILGSLVAFVGVGCVIFNEGFTLSVNFLGDMLSLMAAFSWGIYSIILRSLNAQYDAWFITRKTFFYGVVTAIPFLIFNTKFFDPRVFFSNFTMIGSLVFLILGASVLSYVMWAKVVGKMGAVKANNYLYLQPIFTMIASMIILGERINLMGYIGMALVLGGLWLGDWLNSRFPKEEERPDKQTVPENGETPQSSNQ